MRKSLALLGSTGSIGRQTLEVAESLGLRVEALAANRSVRQLEAQIRRFRPTFCAVCDENAASDLKIRVADLPLKLYGGKEGLLAMISALRCDFLLNAIVGVEGLGPTVAALERGLPLALANKESLVCGGEIVMALAKAKKLPILPVDSEHSAVFQCLRAGRREDVRRLWLTASGGPFFGKSREETYFFTAKQALAHPTWSMGAKITVDSASMMNKGFEVIEAMHLFGMPPEKISVLVHRESIVHSMVEYRDGSVIAQLARPDMRECIQYAMTYPRRVSGLGSPLDLAAAGRLSFAEPDEKAFPLLALAYRAAEGGGLLPAAMNAANDTAVEAFLQGKIPFGGIYEIVRDVTAACAPKKGETPAERPNLAAVFAVLEKAKALAAEKTAAFSPA